MRRVNRATLSWSAPLIEPGRTIMRTRGRLSVLIVLACVLFAPLTCGAVQPYVGLFVGAAIPQDTDIEPASSSIRQSWAVTSDWSQRSITSSPTSVRGWSRVRSRIHRPGVRRIQGRPRDRGRAERTPPVSVRGGSAVPARSVPAVSRAGVGAFIANLKTSIGFLDVPQTVSDTDVKPGFQATVGTRFFLTPHLALFTEWSPAAARGAAFLDTPRPGHLEWIEVVISRPLEDAHGVS